MIFIHDNQTQYTADEGVGTKAQGLFALRQYDHIQVPRWMVLPADFTAEAFKSLSSISRTADLLRAIDQYVFPASLEAELEMFFPDDTHLTVRASAFLEEEHALHLSPEFPSYLSVPRVEVWQKIRAIWRAAFSNKVLDYRSANRLPPMLGVAVIIQETVHAEASGRAYGLHPHSGNRKEKWISAVLGVGAEHSGDAVDIYTIKTGRIDRQIARKRERLTIQSDHEGTLLSVPVARVHQHDQAVADEHLHALAELLDDLRFRHRRFYQLEFAILQDQLYILQADPVMGLEKLPDTTANNIFWDRHAFTGRFSGVLYPLVISCIRAYTIANAKSQAQFLGATTSAVVRHASVFTKLIGVIHGRIYDNLSSKAEVEMMLPGHRIAIHFQDKVSSEVDLPLKTTEQHEISSNEAWKRTLGVSFRLFRDHRKLDKEARDFSNDVDRVLKRYRHADWQDKSPQELMQMYLQIERGILGNWKTPEKVRFYFDTVFRWLQRDTQQHATGHDAVVDGQHPNLALALLIETGDMKSRLPLARRLEIVRKIAGSALFKALFDKEDEQQIWHFIQHDRQQETVNMRHVLEEYLSEGCDLDPLGAILDDSHREKQGIRFVRLLKLYRSAGISDLDQAQLVENRLREQAEEVMEERLRRRYLKRWWYRKMLQRARQLLRMGEDFEYDYARIWAVVKQLFATMGRRFTEEGFLEFSHDIFFLKKDEIFSFIDGRSFGVDLKAIVAVRKEEYERFLRLPEPAMQMVTFGIPYRSNDFMEPPVGEEGEPPKIIYGEVSCPGKIIGKVRLLSGKSMSHKSPVVSDLDSISINRGEVLVLQNEDARATHLLPYVAAIVIETSDVWSSLSVLARQMNIPCIVSARGIMSLVKEGCDLEVDAHVGFAKLVD